MARNRRNSHQKSTVAILRRAVHVVLAISLWHAPIPWLHAHELRGPRVEKLVSLHRHVAEFHALEIEKGISQLALHAHVVLPWGHIDEPVQSPYESHEQGTDGIDFALQAGAAPDALLKISGPPTCRAFDILVTAAAPMAAPGFPNRSPDDFLTHGRHFLETFGPGVSARDLLGVWLC